MPNDEAGLELRELGGACFAGATHPSRLGSKRAVFIDEAVAARFGSDDEVEQALLALLQASSHVRNVG